MTFFRFRPAAPVLSLAILVAASAPAQTPPVNPPHNPRIAELVQSLGKVEQIRETNLSPDGKWIVWSESGPAGFGLRLKSLADPGAEETISACTGGERGMESEPVFSPDSQQIAFLSDCTADHKPAIFLADASGKSQPRQLAELNGYAHELTWSPDGKQLSFLYVEGSTRRPSPVAAEPLPEGVIGVEGLVVQRVGSVDASSGALTQITPANLYVYEFGWSPDSAKLAYIAAPPPGENNWWVAKLYTQAAGSEPTAIVDPATVSGSLHGLQMAVPRWSPDGQQIAFIGGLMSDQGSTGGDIYVVPADGGQPRDLTAEMDSTPVWVRWKSNNELQFTEIVSGASALAHLSLTRSTQPGVDFVLPESIGAGGLSMRLSISRDGSAAMIRNSFSQAPEVWVWAPQADAQNRHFTRITSLNSNLSPQWGGAVPMGWTNEGFRIDGWLLLPAHFDPAKKYPLIVYVHGGPSAANMPRWPGAGYGPVPFSALDYFVLMPNPRGSYGQGERFTQANRKDFGYGDLRDILAGVDAVEKQYPVDDHRVGITGWSYGGFMTMFAVTQTHRFRAAVSGAGLSDWLSYYGENSIDQWMIPFFGASVYDDPAVYAKSSAINFVKNVRTPTLMVVGDRDGECPAPQSFEFWHALHDLGVPTQLVVYPNEGHGFVNPVHRLDVLERAVAWFNDYMP